MPRRWLWRQASQGVYPEPLQLSGAMPQTYSRPTAWNLLLKLSGSGDLVSEHFWAHGTDPFVLLAENQTPS